MFKREVTNVREGEIFNMGRTKPSTMREGVKLGSGMPYFSFEDGKKYKIVFPAIGGDIFAYMEAVHTTHINGKFGKIRCVNANYQVNEESKQAVIKYNENHELALDNASGRVLNDGTCPVCELESLYRQYVFAEGEKFKAENPNATEKERKAFYKKLFDKAPVDAVADKDANKVLKLKTTKILLGLVYTLDEKNNYVTDNDGFPQYTLQIFDLSDARYEKIFSAAENNKEYMSETLQKYTDEDGLAWTEFIFDFPNRDGDKALSGKDLNISVVPSGHSAIEKYDALYGKIVEELGDGEKFEKIFENLNSLRVRNIPEIEKDLQGKLQLYRDTLSDKEKEELDEELEKEEKHITEEEGEKLLADTEKPAVATETATETASGADAFLA